MPPNGNSASDQEMLLMNIDSIAKPHRGGLQVFAPSRSAAGEVGCSAETGSDAGKVFLRASSSAFFCCVRSRVRRARLS